MRDDPRQDPLIKGNPFSAVWDEGDHAWRVQSASAPRVAYRVGPGGTDCSCEAARMCWHRLIIPLADQILSVQASARSYYANWRLRELQAEDARLRATVEAGGGWFVRAQLSVVGDEILDRLIDAEQAA